MPLSHLRRLASAFFSLKQPGRAAPPMIAHVRGEDPRLAEATRLARERFPEFLAAWERRKPGDHFAVKVPVPLGDKPEDGAEHMWFNVEMIHEGRIVGTLDSDALHFSIKAGYRVKIEPHEIEDWTAPAPDGDLMGGFSILALAQMNADR